MNGAFIKIYIQTYNSPDIAEFREEVSQLTLFNYYICLNGYTPCDIDSSFKCLKDEGFFTYNDNGKTRYFSSIFKDKIISVFQKFTIPYYFSFVLSIASNYVWVRRTH